MELSAKTGVQRVRHEVRKRNLVVSQVEQLTPEYLRVTLSGPDLEGFTSMSFDDHIKLILADDEEARVWRDFTPQSFDPVKQELALEFAMHPVGAASDWAKAAAVGTAITIAGPRGSMLIPTDYDWHLFVGDAAALPAIRRRLAELPASAKVTVIAADDNDGTLLNAAGTSWQIKRVADDMEMIQAVSDLEFPAGQGFCWCAGEAAAMKQLRELLANEKNHPKGAMRVAAYWKNGVVNHHENLE
ncbi:siderophore-interacting protein [Pseudoduganella violaceinigra]|uniref:siderophore-interacting protein n=1 Tax=Pseudoduganella violaceinigra TaxID=246602 RepID=UPI00041D1DC8|nr:siderophore-interacting protein [Pseudoduganella violaceinigra]